MLSLHLPRADITATPHRSLPSAPISQVKNMEAWRGCGTCPERVNSTYRSEERRGPHNTGVRDTRPPVPVPRVNFRHMAPVSADTDLPVPTPPCLRIPGFWISSSNTHSFSCEHGLRAETEIAVAIRLAAGQKLGPLLTTPEGFLAVSCA